MAQDAVNAARQAANQIDSVGWREYADSDGCITIKGKDREGDHGIDVRRLQVRPIGSVPDTTLEYTAFVSLSTSHLA